MVQGLMSSSNTHTPVRLADAAVSRRVTTIIIAIAT
jgi:hypothetical protein